MNYNDPNIKITDGTSPDNPNQSTGKIPLPNADRSLWLGILSFCTTICLCICCGSIIGLITSIIGLKHANRAIKKYNENPGLYAPLSIRKAEIGKQLNTIALIMGPLSIVLMIIFIVLGETGNLVTDFSTKRGGVNNFQSLYDSIKYYLGLK